MEKENTNLLASFCLFTYNQEKYIQKAVEGALNQTYSPLEIIISDDCSTDNTWNIIEQTVTKYDGPHKVILNKNDKNMGIGYHVSKILYDLARGDYLILTAGDDISKKECAVEAVHYIEMYPEINMIDFSGVIIDETDKVTDEINLDFDARVYSITDFLNVKAILSFAPCRIIRRNFLLQFNPISKNCPTEDSVLVLRSYLVGGFMRVNRNLVFYRRHDSNISSLKGLRTLSNCAIISQYLKDMNHIYDKGIMTDNMYEQILDRIYLELKLRKIRYTGQRKRILKSILIRILKFIYRINNKLLAL